MEINADVISQGIVLASILAGFGLAITAQIALSAEDKDKYSEVVNWFVFSSTGCVMSVVVGMVYMSTANHPSHVGMGVATLVILAIALGSFFAGILNLTSIAFSRIHPTIYMAIFGMVTFALGLMILVSGEIDTPFGP